MHLLSRSGGRLVAGMLIRLLAPLAFVALIVAVSSLHSNQLAGELVTLISIVIVCSTIGRLGFDQLILQKSADSSLNSKELIRSCVILGTVFTALVASFFYLAVHFTPLFRSITHIAGPAIIFSCVLASLAQLSSSFAQSRLQTTLATVLFPVLTYVLVFVALVILKWPLQISALIAYAVPAAIGLWVLVLAGILTTATYATSVVRQSKYYAINNIAALSYSSLINVYISVLLGAEEVVVFTLITRIAAILSLPANASTPLIQAGISEKHNLGDVRSVARLSGVIVVATTLLQLSCILLITLLGIFTNHLDGLFKSGLLLAFLLYCGSHIFHVLAGPAGTILLMTGEAKKVSRLTILLGAMSLTFGFVFTWIYGLAGTLWVCGIISIVQNMCYSAMLYRRDGYLPIQAALSSIKNLVSTSGTRSAT